MYMGLTGKLKCTQSSHKCLRMVLLKVKLLLENWKGISQQELITFHHNRLKDEVKHYILKPTNLFILFGIRKNCHSTEKSPLLNPFLWADTIKRGLIEKGCGPNSFGSGDDSAENSCEHGNECPSSIKIREFLD
jgi:hypothetical protein